jgi:hypothetical protein
LRDQLEWKTVVAELLDRYIRAEEELERQVDRQASSIPEEKGREKGTTAKEQNE